MAQSPVIQMESNGYDNDEIELDEDKILSLLEVEDDLVVTTE
jgi:hypothetical protein